MKLSKLQFWLLTIFIVISFFYFFDKMSSSSSNQPTAKPSPETNQPPTLIPTTPPSSIDEIQKKDQENAESKSILESSQKREAHLESFVTSFLTDLYHYESKKPTAHVERVKNRLDSALYEMLKAQYKDPFVDTKAMKFKDFQIQSKEIEDTQDLRLELLVNITFTQSDNTTVTEPQVVALTLKPNGDTWKVRWLESANSAD